MQNNSRSFMQSLKSGLYRFVYFVEKEILEPFVRTENFKYRIDGYNQSLSHMDYDGGQITNNTEVTLVEGHVAENRFQAIIFKLLKFTHDWRNQLMVNPKSS